MTDAGDPYRVKIKVSYHVDSSILVSVSLFTCYHSKKMFDIY